MTRAGPVDGAPPPAGWRQLRRVATTGSTNADLVALAAAGEPAGLVLVADEQTAGRGRLGRGWTAPPGSGLTFSVLLRPHRAAAHLGWLPLLTGLAVVEAVRSVTGVPAELKWPNDVVVRGDGGEGKLAGILAERLGGPGAGAGAVVVGVGLNVSMSTDELPVHTATSLLVNWMLGPSSPALSGFFASTTNAVIVLVMLAIGRLAFVPWNSETPG